MAGKSDANFPTIQYLNVLPPLNAFKSAIQSSSIPDSGDVTETDHWSSFISQAESIKSLCEGFPEDFQKMMSDILKKYIEGNIQIDYSWNGISPAPSPDTTVSFTVKNSPLKLNGVIIFDFSLSPVPTHLLLGVQMQAMIVGSKITLPPTFQLAPSKMICKTPVPYAPTGLEGAEDNMSDFATKTITSIKGSANPGPLLGTHVVGPITYAAPPGVGAIMVSIS